jgi:hypothetical protein
MNTSASVPLWAIPCAMARSPKFSFSILTTSARAPHGESGDLPMRIGGLLCRGSARKRKHKRR